jgi:hypothetical protein
MGLLGLMAVALVLQLPVFVSNQGLKWVGMLVANIAVIVISLAVVTFAARRSRSVALRGVAGAER